MRVGNCPDSDPQLCKQFISISGMAGVYWISTGGPVEDTHMTIETKQDGNTAVVSISGKLDGLTSPEFKKTIRGLVESGTTRLVVDFHELRVITSVGISEILLAAKLLREKDGQFALVSVEGSVLKVFAMCGMGTLFHNYPSVADALAAMS